MRIASPLGRTFSVGVACTILVSCGGGSQPQAVAPDAAISNVRNESYGNIFWNKGELHVSFPSKSYAYATLTYWAPNGYFAAPHDCKREGSFSAIPQHHRTGNPHGYMHVVYAFKATSPGPNTCGFTVILSDTGSPPIASIRVIVDSR